MVRYVENQDKEAWYKLDHDFPETSFDEKVRNREGYVCTAGGKTVGILRYNLFWDKIPFCNMLYVAKEYRGRGYGKQLMEHWEKDMKSNGCGMVMTSTQVNEDAQNFYRKLGFKESGGFVIDVPGYEQPMEMIMIKAI